MLYNTMEDGTASAPGDYQIIAKGRGYLYAPFFYIFKISTPIRKWERALVCAYAPAPMT